MTAIQRTKFEVAHGERGWTVSREGFGVDSTFLTKQAAVKRAVRIAKERQPSELVILRQDGSVQETRTYGADPDKLIKLM